MIDEIGDPLLHLLRNAVDHGVEQADRAAGNQGLRLQVTPPGVFCDMAGAAINVASLEVAMYADEALVIAANFEHRGRHLPAWFLACPQPNQIRALLSDRGAARDQAGRSRRPGGDADGDGPAADRDRGDQERRA